MSDQRRRAALIFNPASGKGEDDLERVRDVLAARFTLSVFSTCAERDADACAQQAVEAGAELVIAAGGDGTVSLAAAALVGTGVPLGIIARGTSNSIADGLGIPADLESALANLVDGQARPMDTARANGRIMVLHASVGFHAATVGGTDREDKNRWGVLAYLKEGLHQLREAEPFLVEIETETEIVRCRATNLTVANLAPLKTLLAQGPASVSPQDGELDLTIVAASGLAEAVATGLHLLRTAAQGQPATRDNVGFLSARSFRIKTDPPQPLIVDGEDAGVGQLVLRCLPASLLIIVPAPPPVAVPGDDKLEGLPELEVHSKG